jgi:GNAT superfamily N-acetyltransferase
MTKSTRHSTPNAVAVWPGSRANPHRTTNPVSAPSVVRARAIYADLAVTSVTWIDRATKIKPVRPPATTPTKVKKPCQSGNALASMSRQSKEVDTISDMPRSGPKRPDLGAGPSSTSTTDLEIEPLTPGRFQDLAALFEEGGDPKWCWCVFFRFRGRDWTNSTADDNRAALKVLTDRALAPGLVAYRGDRAVGWVSLGPREDYERLVYSKVLAPVDDTPVWSIVCFVVSRTARGQGVAAGLLTGAIDFAREHGATMLEAYPVDTGAARVPAANAFGGPMAMFEKAGFLVVERRQWNASTPVRLIVRMSLEPVPG